MLSRLKPGESGKHLEDQELIMKIKEYLEENYIDDIQDFEHFGVGSESLFLDMEKLKKDDKGLYERFEETPEEALYSGDIALQLAIEEETNMTDSNHMLRLKNYEGKMLDIQDIRKRDLNSLICIEGSISKKSDVTPVATSVAFECKSCGNVMEVVQDKEDIEEPTFPVACGDCEAKSKNNFLPIPEETEFENYQHLVIQEHPEKSPAGETPKEMDVMIHGDITGETKPGERVTIIGILTPVLKLQNGVLQSTSVDRHVKGISVIPDEKDYEELEITDEDIRKIKELSQQDDLYERFAKSVAPSIKGHETKKKGIVHQLFGGKRKNTYDTSVRGDIHILLVGDPSTGKSQILQHVEKLSPRGMYASGKGASEAGLTAAAIREGELGNKWVLEAGVLPLADKGIACVDEIDKMDSSDRGALHEALEQQHVSIDKAGINTKLQSRCALLAAANPDGDRFDEMQSIPKQIDLEPALISRFDLIFLFQDEIDEDKDRMIADHILDTHIKGQKEMREDIEEEGASPEIDPDLMKKYIAYSRQEIDPVIQPEAREYLEEMYLGIRSQGNEEEDVIPVTHRKLEGSIRLTEASARIRLSQEATLEDAKKASEIMEFSLRQTGYDKEADRFDADKIERGETKTKTDRKSALKSIIKDLEDSEDVEVHDREKVLEKAQSSVGLSKEKAEEAFDNLRADGEIYEGPNNNIKVVNDE